MLFSCAEMKNCGFNINQYLIKNIVVAENYKMQNIDITKNPYERLLTKHKTKADIRTDNKVNFQNEMQKMIGKIRSNTNG